MYTDDLTGLGNKRALRRHRARLDNDADIRWIALDADVFKRLNDCCGEDEGDIALQHFARVIRRVCADFRVDVPAFRHGGDEYGVAAPIAIAEKLLRAIEVASPYTKGQITTKLSGAVGDTYTDASSLLKAIKEARRQVDPSLRREAR